MEGSDSVRLQEALKRAGITVDGEFEPGTDQAVKAFQQQQSLTADGIVGSTGVFIGMRYTLYPVPYTLSSQAVPHVSEKGCKTLAAIA